MPHESTLVGLEVEDAEGVFTLAQNPASTTVPCPTICNQGTGPDEFPNKVYVHLSTAYIVLTECSPPCAGSIPCLYCNINPFPDNDFTLDPPFRNGVIQMLQTNYESGGSGKCYCTETSNFACCWCFGSDSPSDPWSKPPTGCDGRTATGAPVSFNIEGSVYQAGAFCAALTPTFFGWVIMVMVANCPCSGITCGPDCNGRFPGDVCSCDEIVFFSVYVKPNVPTAEHTEGTLLGQYSLIATTVPDPANRLCDGQVIPAPSLLVSTDPTPLQLPP